MSRYSDKVAARRAAAGAAIDIALGTAPAPKPKTPPPEPRGVLVELGAMPASCADALAAAADALDRAAATRLRRMPSGPKPAAR